MTDLEWTENRKLRAKERAAQEMYEALKSVRDQTLMIQHGQETRLHDIYDIAVAALAKADNP